MRTLALLSAASAVAAAAPPKAVVFILADDFGYYDAGLEEPSQAPAPNLRALAKQGVIMNSHYVYQYCSPTRSSLMSGRLPIHVHTENTPTTKPGGVDLRMKTLPELLKEADPTYSTFYVGKWHAGGHLEGQTPRNRGFDSAFGYLNGMEDHFTQRFDMLGGVDLWLDDGPALGLNGTYGGTMYTERAVAAIDAHDASKGPLFGYVAFQNTHEPLQVPPAYIDPTIQPASRASYYGMTAFMDEAIGNVTAALRRKFAWNDTLIVFSADNGGDLESAGNNHPRRGSKYTDFQGGVSSAAFVSGGYVPEAVRGSATDEKIHVTDWWRTIAELAGAEVGDGLVGGAEAGNVPPPDAVNVWEAVSTPGGRSGRTEVPVSANTLIREDLKLVTDQPAGSKDKRNAWAPTDWPAGTLELGPACDPCLFNLTADPQERNDLSKDPSMAAALASMLKRLAYWKSTVWESAKIAYSGPYTNCTTNDAFKQAHGGFVGPLCTKPAA